MRVWLLFILLGFPVLEAAVSIEIGRHIGWWLLVWLVLSAATGMALIKEARFSMLRELGFALQSGGSNIHALIGSGRTLLAGLLFIFPGIISDLLALGLILWPHGRGHGHMAHAGATQGERVIEGHFRRER
jgi:UPF0716 protein FxsA